MSLDVNISEPDEFNCVELHNCIQSVAAIKEIRDYTYHVDIVSESFQTSLNLIDKTNIKENLEQNKDNILDLLRRYTKPRKYNVFCHGDYWINNILFKEGEEQKICFLDFQAMRFASPVTDILYFLYICTDSKFRANYFTDLINDYHDSLKSFLDLFQIDADEVFPKNEFENDLEEMLPFGLLVALIELKLVTTTPDDVEITENMDTPGLGDIIYMPGGEELYKLRVNDVIDESDANGVLNQLLNDLNVKKPQLSITS
ncbi:jg26566 [Pararge aegeria aegeria]|uniref:Jg26566 protein n=1 Tax=Pararge aegeria aegeria TaxID=348720 RepID=A0A8S4SD48_9NEOP|nr:jg26566 [Pararge aegeria aegeria]